MKLIKHTSPVKPSFGATTGDNALATVKDANQIINYLNAIADNTNKNIDTYFLISANAAGTISDATNACPACLGNGTVCGSYKVYGCYKATATLTPNATGDFTVDFVLPSTTAVPTLGTSVAVENMALKGFVTVVQVTPLQYTIKTYDSAGAAADSILNNSTLRLTVFVDTDNIIWE